jgi:very-short-patch-repair endonuclease
MVDKEIKEQIIRDYIDNWLSLSEISKKYGIKSKSYISQYILGDKVRSSSEAVKLAHKKHPNKFKLSEETKDKIRNAHLRWMKEHPEQTAWRLKNMSYPEKCFQKILEDNGLDKKYLVYREYSVFPYFIDFAFINEKLAVEIDGSQHLEEDRKRRDKKKDALLLSKGWKVLRIAANEVTHDGTKALKAVLDMLEEPTTHYEIVGILKAPKAYQKAVRGEDGLSDKQRLNAFKQRKVERPSKEELFEMVKNKPFTTIANEYGVSDKAVSKWCKQYGLPHRKKDIDQLIDKQHKHSKEMHICLRCGKEYYTYNHNSKFCCDDCYKVYIKENGLLDKENRKKSNLWVYKINDDNSFVNKRIGEDKVEEYVAQGWIRGRKLS